MRRRTFELAATILCFSVAIWGCPPDDTTDDDDATAMDAEGETGIDVVDDDGGTDAEGGDTVDDDGGGAEDADSGGMDACIPSETGNEICNGKDDDCDGDTDECCDVYWKDDDQDGFGEDDQDSLEACGDPGNQFAKKSNGEDCDDLDSSINPSASEECNQKDDNCDGNTDEGVTTTYYEDQDEDGYGTTNNTKDQCNSPGAKWATQKNDCNDLDSSINPGQNEVCGNNKDDDCDGNTDENCGNTCYHDNDSDTYGDPNDTASCGTSGYIQTAGDCNDNDANINPGAAEVCDQKDNDCDGNTDECCTTYYRDADGDGHGTPNDTKRKCSQPSGYVTNSDDCLDTDSDVYSGQTQYFASTTDAGGYDYNCDQNEERRWTDETAMCNRACVANRGWKDGTAPDCGDPAEDYLTSCTVGTGGSCQPNYTSRQQECR